MSGKLGGSKQGGSGNASDAPSSLSVSSFIEESHDFVTSFTFADFLRVLSLTVRGKDCQRARFAFDIFYYAAKIVPKGEGHPDGSARSSMRGGSKGSGKGGKGKEQGKWRMVSIYDALQVAMICIEERRKGEGVQKRREKAGDREDGRGEEEESTSDRDIRVYI